MSYLQFASGMGASSADTTPFAWSAPWSSKGQPTTTAGKLRVLDTVAVPIVGPILAAMGVKVPGPFQIIASLEGGSSTSSRMGKFNADLQSAKDNVGQAMTSVFPQAQKLLTDFVSAGKQMVTVTQQAQDSTDSGVGDAVSVLASDFQNADSAITNPISDLLGQIQDAADAYQAGVAKINPWNTMDPSLVALDALDKKLMPALTKVVSAAKKPLSTFQRDLAVAKGVVQKDADARAAAAKQAQIDAMNSAASTLRDAITASDQAAQYGDFDTALGLLQDPAISTLAATVNWTSAVNARISALTGAKTQRDQMIQMTQMMQAYQQSQQPPQAGSY